MKFLAKWFLAMGILLCISGVWCGKVSDANKPKRIEVGYGAMIDGELVMVDEIEENTVVGSGNRENLEKFQTLSLVCYMFAGGSFIGAVVCFLKKPHV